MKAPALLATAAAALLLATSSGGAAAPQAVRTALYTGYGFEACTAPSVAALRAWTASPYRAVGIYIGGVNRACADGNLSAAWVSATLSLGWSLMPLYVGLQAPCVGQARLATLSTNVATAAQQGRAAADDAIGRASTFALPAGSPIYLDMEGYRSNDAACTRAVQSFVGGWSSELRAQGYLSGVYGSAASTIRDVAALGPARPDNAWIANWNGVEGVFGDPYVSDALWSNHQRIHQYKGGHRETYGGVTINIDSDYVDAPVVRNAGTAPPSPPAEPPAGSVGSGDLKATATWPQGAFDATAAVTLSPTTAAPSPNGYAAQLTVTDPRTSTAIARFAAPVIVHLLMKTGGLAPSWSADGTTWKSLRRLAAAALPAGVDNGYTLDPDGTIEIQTLVPGYFGLLPDTTPPSQVQAAARFVNGALRLTWPAATDNVGLPPTYQVLLDGNAVSSLPSSARRVIVRGFSTSAPSVYRIRAVDAAGILGKVSRPVVVVPAARPADTPRLLPRWAWGLLAFQHRSGPRPAAAPRKLPAWYWHWAAWRAAPFRVRG